MRTQGSGSATFLMLFVMGVTAVIGVFGLPQFEPVVASSKEPTLNEQWSDGVASYQQAGAGESIAQGVEDLFAPNEASAETATAANGDLFESLDLDRLEDEAAGERQIVDLIGESSESVGLDEGTGSNAASSILAGIEESPFPESQPRVAVAAESPTPRVAVEGAGFDSRFGRRPSEHPVVANANEIFPNGKASSQNGVQPKATETIEPLSWRAAVSRLNSLGIRKYRLTPGTHPNEFHFSCFFSPSDNPRITHRFEAEATEPLQAVQKVLAQVDRWRIGR